MSFQSELREWGQALKEIWQDSWQKTRDNPLYWVVILIAFLTAFFGFLAKH